MRPSSSTGSGSKRTVQQWKCKALLAAIGACAISGMVTAAPISEDQLSTMEKDNVVKGGQPSWDFLFKRFPQLGYLAAFETVYATATTAPAGQEAASAPPETVQVASYSPNMSARIGYGRASDVAALGSAATTPFGGSLTPGAPAHTIGGALAVVSIGFSVLEFFSSGNVDDRMRASILKELNAPSIYITKRGGPLPNDAARYTEIVAGQKLLQSFGTQCEPARWHSSREQSVGGVLPSTSHARMYVCGYGPDEDIGYLHNGDEIRTHKVVSITDGTSWQIIMLPHLDKMEKLPAALGLTKDQMKESGRVMYEKIKDKVGPEWTVIFTGTGGDNKWHVYAARDGFITEFDTPPK